MITASCQRFRIFSRRSAGRAKGSALGAGVVGRTTHVIIVFLALLGIAAARILWNGFFGWLEPGSWPS